MAGWIPDWINRETIQIAFVVAITVGFHYYYISSKFAAFKNDPNNFQVTLDHSSSLDEELE